MKQTIAQQYNNYSFTGVHAASQKQQNIHKQFLLPANSAPQHATFRRYGKISAKVSCIHSLVKIVTCILKYLVIISKYTIQIPAMQMGTAN